MHRDAINSPFESPLGTPPRDLKMDISVTTKKQKDEEKRRTYSHFHKQKRNNSLAPPVVRHKTNFGYTFKEISA
jgi:hypothetical protein